MATLLNSSLCFLPQFPSEITVKAFSLENPNSSSQWKSLYDNFGSKGAAVRNRSAALEDSCSRVRSTRILPLKSFVENSWSVGSPPRTLTLRSASRIGCRTPLSSRGQVFAASTGPGNTGKPLPEEEDPEAGAGLGRPDQPKEAPQVGGGVEDLDWRAFRARLVQSEQVESGTTIVAGSNTAAEKKWAHPILAPEAGCLLIATEKLDGQQSFERTVILMLSSGSPSNPREGPYGFILNKPISRRIKEIKPKDRLLVKQFGNCPAHLGGPLDTEVFLLLHGTSGLPGYQEVIPGVYYGAADGLEPAFQFAKEGSHSYPEGFRFFFGYSGWGYDQLKQEIDAGLWYVAACSSELITSASTSALWEEVLQLMGGKYAELSKRPKRKHF